jgi:isocitrate dehydrogenase (NAD+)
VTRDIALIPGDGIGPEVVEAARKVLEASGFAANWLSYPAGQASFEACGDPLPAATLEGVRNAAATLKGPTATAKGGGFRSVNVALRQKLQLYANYRPARSIPGVKTRFDDVDLIVIRENTEGLYSGLEHEVVPGVVESLRVITRDASRRIARFAFETARRQGRRRVTCIHKANILKLSDGLFLQSCRETAAEFSDIEFDDCIVDAAAMQLVSRPERFDVLVMENLFGDILSDLCSGLVGGLGVTPSANVGTEGAIFEAVHGTAPDIAGQGRANPTALILSAVLMLRMLGEKERADRVEQAVHRVLAAGKVLTGDLGGNATTGQFTDAVIAEL